MTAPVGIITDIGYARDTYQFARIDESKEFLPHRCKIGEVLALSQIFLGNLQFCYLRSLLDVVEDRSVWLTGLEVERTILGLQDDVVSELSIHILKLAYGLFHSVFALVVGTIYKASPHDDATVWLDGIGKHVGSLGMSAVVIARTRLSFRISFYQESAKVWNGSINLLCFLLPPLLYLFIQWVCSLGIAQCHRRSKVDAEIHSDAVRTQDVGDDLHLINIFCRHHLW